jgi:hypothetical protein
LEAVSKLKLQIGRAPFDYAQGEETIRHGIEWKCRSPYRLTLSEVEGRTMGLQQLGCLTREHVRT